MTKDTFWTFQVAKKFKFWTPSLGEILTLHTFIDAEGWMWLQPGRSLPKNVLWEGCDRTTGRHRGLRHC